jgi:hypothetical protein
MSATACTKREMSVVQDVAFSRVVSACLKWQGLHQEKPAARQRKKSASSLGIKY